MDEVLDTTVEGIERRLNSFNYRSWKAIEFEFDSEGASVVEISQESMGVLDTVQKGKILCRNLESAGLAIFIANAPYDMGLMLSNLRAEKLISEQSKKKIELLQNQIESKDEKYSIVVELLKNSGEREAKLQKKIDRLSPKSRATKAKKK